MFNLCVYSVFLLHIGEWDNLNNIISVDHPIDSVQSSIRGTVSTNND